MRNWIGRKIEESAKSKKDALLYVWENAMFLRMAMGSGDLSLRNLLAEVQVSLYISVIADNIFRHM